MMTHYAALNIAPDSTAEDLKKAYRARLRATHPDMGGDAADFDAVQRAWTELGDPARREAYDRLLAATEPDPVADDDPPAAPTDEDFFDGFAEVVEDDPTPSPAPTAPPFSRPAPTPSPVHEAPPAPVDLFLPLPLAFPGIRGVVRNHLAQAAGLGVPAATIARWTASDRLATALCGAFGLLTASGTAFASRGSWGPFLADLLASTPLLGVLLTLAVITGALIGACLAAAGVLALRSPLRLAAHNDRRLLPGLRRLIAACAYLLRPLNALLTRLTDKTPGGTDAAH